MHKFISLLLVCMLVIGVMTACGQADQKPAETKAAEAKADDTKKAEAKTEEPKTSDTKPIKVGFSFASKEGVIYQAFEDYIKKAGQQSNPKVEFTFTVADADVGKQASNVEDLISQKPDVIVLMPQDSKAIVASIKACHKAGIPAMTYNRAASPDADEKADAHVGLDTVDQAYTTAKALFELMKKDGVEMKIINVMGDLRDENAVNRDKGLKKAAQEMGATIVQDVPSEWNPDKALSGLSASLQAHADATAIFVASDFLMPGIQSAMERAKKWIPYGQKGHIYLGSQDVFPSGSKLLKEKIIDVNTAFDIWPMSTAAVDTIIKLAQKKAIDNKNILIKGRLFDQKNINSEQNVWANDYKE